MIPVFPLPQPKMCKLTFKICTILLLVLLIVYVCLQNNTFGVMVEEYEDMMTISISDVFSGNPILSDQADKRIITYIWKHGHIEPPSEQEYILKSPDEDPSRGQGQFIRKLFRNMTDGVFVEAGALDGETRSNTLFLEKYLNWKGLLVEGDPSNYAKMKVKNRKAWTSNTCLAVKSYPHMVEYLQHFNTGRIINSSPNGASIPNTTKVQCMPVFSLLTALNISTVDYFSLDVEGSELDVLRTIPFEKLFIKTLSVEFQHTAGGKRGILDFMRKKGYKLVGEVRPPFAISANDVILVHKSVQFQK